MKLTELAKSKILRSGEKCWFESLPKAQQAEILSELKKWGNGPLAPFAKAVIEKFKIPRKVPAVRDTLRALQNGKFV
jgi:hypothetical protein